MFQELANKVYLFKFDLKNSYHHIDIFNSHQTYLRFSWDIKGATKCFVVTVVLPFGLSSAPFVFTKVVHPLVKQRHLHALEIVGFLDNCLGIAHQYQDAISCFNFVERTLINSDFVQNVTKSVWILCQRIIWLGMEIDINNNISSITSSQITSIFHKI